MRNLIALAVLATLTACGAKPRYENRRPDPVSAIVLTPTLPGTAIWVDGAERGRVGRRDLTIPVTDGARTVRLVAPDGRETSLEVFVQNGSRRMLDPAKAFAEGR